MEISQIIELMGRLNVNRVTGRQMLQATVADVFFVPAEFKAQVSPGRIGNGLRECETS